MSNWSGAWRIVRFNRGFYISAGAVVAICASLGTPVALTVLAGTIFWSVASVIGAHLIYDLSALRDLRWLPGWIGAPGGRWMLLQAGFDSTAGKIAAAFDAPPLAVVDLYGVPGVGGRSVERARSENPSDGTSVAEVPPGDGICDTVVAIFALHEIHDAAARERIFQEFARVLSHDGRLVLIEHGRDLPNFLAFGPGYLHFLPFAEWERCARMAGFSVVRTKKITPFVHAACWGKS